MRALFLVVVASLLVASDASAAAPCRDAGARGFLCTTLTVPLDRDGVRAGTLKLPIAMEPARAGATKLFVALSGGPGQGSVSAARSFRDTLRPALKGARLVVLDQRGTGAIALNCPQMQRLGPLDDVPASAVTGCAARLGPSRADYTTADTVADIDALRARFGAAKITLMGVSYGTYVAAQYARTYPQRVRGLILDSPVGPQGIDPFLLDSLTPLKRIVDGWCTHIRCPASADAPWAALGTVAARLRQKPLSARVADARGRLVTRTIHDEGVLERLIGGGDLNPALQALLPAALTAAAAGDAGPLVRLLPAAEGPPSTIRDFSSGLNTATVCADVALPFNVADDVPTRRASMAAALDAVPPAAYAPLSKQTVFDGSVAADCSVWPDTPGTAKESTAPLPDVPALVLSGSFDQRTPTEGARQLAALLPRSSFVLVRGTGHDTIDSDASGCVARALSRFANGRAVADPCRWADNRWVVPGRLARTRPKTRAQVLDAIVATLHDATLQAVARYYAGYSYLDGGGLLGGYYSGPDGLSLTRYEVVPGVRVTSTDAAGLSFSATLAGGKHVTVTLSPGGLVRAVIGGKRLQVQAPQLVNLAARPPASAAQAAGRYESRR